MVGLNSKHILNLFFCWIVLCSGMGTQLLKIIWIYYKIKYMNKYIVFIEEEGTYKYSIRKGKNQLCGDELELEILM